MVIEGALKDKLEALKFKPVSRRTGKPLVGGQPAEAGRPLSGGQPSEHVGQHSGSEVAGAREGPRAVERLAPQAASRSAVDDRSNLSTAARPHQSNGVKDGLAVHVSVRCRPQLEPTAQILSLTSEPLGTDKVVLRLAGSKEAAETRAAVSGDTTQRTTREVRTFRCNTFLGPESRQQDFSGLLAPIAQHVMDGGNASVMCHGITGSGKSFTMTGSENPSNATGGVVQQVAQHVFESIRDRSGNGKIHLIEASYLQIFSSDGSHEKLIDLLAEVNKELEVKPDPRNPQAFACYGLRRIPIRGPDDVTEVLRQGRGRSRQLEKSEGCLASRSHCVFMLVTESLLEQPGGSEPVVQRGKLLLVDLAGSESLLKAVSTSNDDLARRQALGINRTLASLCTNVNSSTLATTKGSALTQLVKDCMGGAARMLLVATVGPELADIEETAKTLTFAQQMMTSLSARSSPSNSNRIDQDQSSLLQMRERHNDCIRMLKEKVSDSREEEIEDRKRIQQEMKEINERLLTRESAQTSLEAMRQDQFSRFDAMKNDLTQTMSSQIDQMRRHSQQEIDALRQSVEISSLENEKAKKDAQAHEAAMQRMQANLQETQAAQRAAVQEASELRVRVATAEERANMLQARQEELRKERADFEEERKSLRSQGEQQWQRLAVVEAELSKFKSEAESQRSELARLNAVRADEVESARKERENWRVREEKLQNEVQELMKRLEVNRREAEVHALQVESRHQSEISKLKLQTERLEAESKAKAEQLSEAQRNVASLEAERAMAQHREDALRQQASQDIKRWQEELADAKEREEELMKMLSEVQDSIIVASET
eukprot:TRINITY_DN58306_c0_g1_i1.p1 TRINITY_DN58306_c0_g1~~TRINITY_DN58306_c0_g1_i1.p1  ORF type:complete len:856 (+),score=184.55 TRINITY_DN58306_c0_g1_i1:73-2568(+)